MKHKVPLIICFYTIDTPYQQEVLHLIASCEKFGIEKWIEGKVSLGCWQKNCAIKPQYILEKLKQFQRPILWVDADAVFLQKPDFSPFLDCDFSVRINDYLPQDHESKVVSGTIFVNYTIRGIAVVEKWCVETEKQLSLPSRSMEFWDQIALRDVLSKEQRAKILEMPLVFCKVFDFDAPFVSEEETIIEHHQASRRFKWKIK